jgi:adenylate cyclase
MTQEGFKRKLTAIFSADVEGYSRLMGEDEEATVRTLTAYREVLTTLIQQHNGKVVDSPGDNLLAEFASVVDAARCAVAVQKEITSRNDELPENRKMQFRIGINLGDVIEEGDRIYGDGVNIAARLESIAKPGGICISKTAFDQIETKLPYGYEFLGDQTVKNIAKPVGAYQVLMEPRMKVAGGKVKFPKTPLWKRKNVFVGAVAVIVAIIVLGVWNIYFRTTQIKPTSLEKMTYPLPEKPSVAVLPFNNLSGDPDQEYIADGMTENIITALSYIPELFVIARNSTFTYKGKAVKVQEVAEDLGVRYILEGSVQRAGDRIRIMAQLIDAASGRHLWADRYDRDLQDFFALQDEITLKIVLALQVKLSGRVQTRLTGETIPNFEAWSYAVRGSDHRARHTKADNAKARELFERAASLAPGYANVFTALGWTYWEDAYHGWNEPGEASLPRAVELAKKALAMDDSDPDVHALWGAIYLKQGLYDQAISAGERSVALGPNQSFPHLLLGMYLSATRRYKEALPHVKKAMRLDPYYPSVYLELLGGIYYLLGEHEEALEAFKVLVAREPHGVVGRQGLVMSYIRLDRKEHARSEVKELSRLFPEYSLEMYKKQALRMRIDPAVLASDIEVLREAGVR